MINMMIRMIKLFRLLSVTITLFIPMLTRLINSQHIIDKVRSQIDILLSQMPMKVIGFNHHLHIQLMVRKEIVVVFLSVLMVSLIRQTSSTMLLMKH
jgi:hypothetical protein